MRVVVFKVVVVAVAVAGGCAPPRSAPPPFGPCDVQPAGERAQAEEELQRILVTIDYFLDEAAGGPLTCTPGPGDACDPCLGGVVTLPIGVQTTLAVEARTNIAISATLGVSELVVGAGHEGEATVLAPIPTEVANGAVDIFIGVTPTSTEPVSATFRVTSSADNQRAATDSESGYPITIQYAGVDGG